MVLNVPGRPADWVGGGIVLTVVFFVLTMTGGLYQPLLLLAMPVAMFAAVISAYQEAARWRADARPQGLTEERAEEGVEALAGTHADPRSESRDEESTGEPGPDQAGTAETRTTGRTEPADS
ncbi:hypothetical protein [Streptosporangium carneum]|uniref:Uncharacterized protein n=1 Tax=Streptosporangium carneum TaxID=47481 RepID=A0A9W6I3V2_9ACTN|nr:hypothetical protein [Streptosporangium carneum]GLK11178.1 hypothetical protein GCM10017600_45840 [Streptosporangium carneum]